MFLTSVFSFFLFGKRSKKKQTKLVCSVKLSRQIVKRIKGYASGSTACSSPGEQDYSKQELVPVALVSSILLFSSSIGA